MMMQALNGAEMNGLGGLEDILSNLIEPVNPDPKFVAALKLKLSNAPAVLIEQGNKHLPLFAAAAGLAAGVFLFYMLSKKKENSD